MLACMIALIAIISAVVYVLVPFRPQHLKAPGTSLSPHQTSAVSSRGNIGAGY
jgi:hypothetical protein